jgi:Raf kinase inhibitor-like YbhB/YbcL family protein
LAGHSDGTAGTLALWQTIAMVDDDPYARLAPVPRFALTSEDITDGRPLPVAQRAASLGGSDSSPHLAWSDFPAGTKSFAVTCYDPDAPTGSGFWHWAVYNIPVSAVSLPSGAGDAGGTLLPAGAVTLPNEYRLTRYSGAEPPEGTGVHRYYFVVHAIDVDHLDLPEGSTPAVLGFNLHFHTVARAILMATAAFDESA